MKNNSITLLDKCHLNFDSSWQYIDEMIDARTLLSPNRFDLYAILLYIDHKLRGVVGELEYAKNVYYQRTNIITGFTCSEKGNDKKNAFEDFVFYLDALIDDFQNDRYDALRSPVPVDCNNVIVDGAHRVACAAYFNRKVRVIRFVDKDFGQHVTADFLLSNTLPTTVADAMALEATRHHDNLYMLFLWPKAFRDSGKLKQAHRIISNKVPIVYHKIEKMTYNGIRNLMIQIYSHMDWIGTVDNDFYNTHVKADEVWNENGQVEFILVEGKDTQEILKLKAEIRNLYGIGLASVHSTDNIIETRIAAELIYNQNSLHHLQFGHPTKFPHSHHMIEKFKESITKHGYEVRDFVIDSSMILAMYGIRAANDLDYYTSLENVDLRNDAYEQHDDFIKFHHFPKETLIYSPDKYFVYNGLKFISLDQLSFFKKSRGEKKDFNDLKMIEAYSTKPNKWKFLILRINDTIMRKKLIYKRKSKMFVKIGLIKLHLFDVLYSIYGKIK